MSQDNVLRIGVASSALFNLSLPNDVFEEEGEEAYREYQLEHQDIPLELGLAYSFVKKALSLNSLSDSDAPLVEVILLSRNCPITGLRAMNTIEQMNLPIRRAIFLQGRSPWPYLGGLDIDLFLSSNFEDVKNAIEAGYPAGHVLGGNSVDESKTLDIAFDFDSVISTDSSERIYKEGGLQKFIEHEVKHADQALAPGPMARFIKKLSYIQKQEDLFRPSDSTEPRMLNISIITARGAPTHKRVIATLQEMEVNVNAAFFMAGTNKKIILDTLKPTMFLDDQLLHLDNDHTCVHVPFGIRNK